MMLVQFIILTVDYLARPGKAVELGCLFLQSSEDANIVNDGEHECGSLIAKNAADFGTNVLKF